MVLTAIQTALTIAFNTVSVATIAFTATVFLVEAVARWKAIEQETLCLQHGEQLQETINERTDANTWADWVRQQWENRADKIQLLRQLRTQIKQPLGETHIAMQTMALYDYSSPINPNLGIDQLTQHSSRTT